MKLHTLMTGAALTAILAGGAFAQSTATTPETGTDAPPMATDGMATDAAPLPGDPMATEPPAAPRFTSIEEMTVGDVLGMVAYDPEGNTIGEVDYVLNPESGPVFVLGIGGFIGLGEYTVALPIEDFKLGENGTSFTLNTDKETLKAQPEFDESEVTGLPDDTPIASLLNPEADAPAEEAPETAPLPQG